MMGEHAQEHVSVRAWADRTNLKVEIWAFGLGEIAFIE
jgi:hypothetical protein